MEHRRVGTTDLNVSVLGFGCAPVGSRAGYGESERALNEAFERGVTFFDTADMYGVGGSEETLRRVFGDRRERVVIATKCGYTFSSRLKAVAWVKPLLRPLVNRLKGVKASASAVMASQRSQSFEPAYIRSSVEGSLGRLGREAIDLFYLHDPAMGVVERPEVFETLRALKSAGKIRHIGISSEPDVAARAIQLHGECISAVQVNANLLEPAALIGVLPMARARGIGVVARQPFAHGRLFTDRRLLELAREHGVKSDGPGLSSLAVRYLREFAGICSVLPSMMRREHLRGNVESVAAGGLSEAERGLIEAMGAPLPSGNEG